MRAVHAAQHADCLVASSFLYPLTDTAPLPRLMATRVHGAKQAW
jgi:hypothetical protein